MRIYAMMKQYRSSLSAGFPFWWGLRTAWAWRNGPNAELRAAHRDYVQASMRR